MRLWQATKKQEVTDKIHVVAVIGPDEERRRVIERAFVGAGFQTISAKHVSDLDIGQSSWPVDVIFDGLAQQDFTAEIAEAREHWATADIWGISETTKFVTGWGKSGAEATPSSARVLRCEAVLQQALESLSSTSHVAERLDQQILKAKKELEGIIDASPEPVFLCSPERRILRANKAFFEKVGAVPADVIGQRCEELVHGTSGTLHDCLQKEVREGGRPVTRTRDDLTFGGAYECTAFQVFVEGEAIGTAHLLRRVDEDEATP